MDDFQQSMVLEWLVSEGDSDTRIEVSANTTDASLEDMAQHFVGFLRAAGYRVEGLTIFTETNEFSSEY